MRKFRTSIGYARQEDDKDPLWSRKVGDIVFDYAEGSSLFNSKNEIEDSINAAYSGLHCETYAGGELMKRRIDVCSGGEKRMVAILSAFSRINSKLFILDEPVNNLDGEHSRYLNNFIIDLKHKQNPPGILIITHCHMFHKVDRAYKLIKDKTGGGVLTEISNYCTMSDSCFGKCDINGKYNI
jgi:ABC-type multidrug transport system ATPase subunit